MQKRLIQLRQERGWSMREAAKRIGVAETTYREWEYGRSIKGEWYPRIAKAFEIKIDELFGLEAEGSGSVEEWFDRTISHLKNLKEKLIKERG